MSDRAVVWERVGYLVPVGQRFVQGEFWVRRAGGGLIYVYRSQTKAIAAARELDDLDKRALVAAATLLVASRVDAEPLPAEGLAVLRYEDTSGAAVFVSLGRKGPVEEKGFRSILDLEEETRRDDTRESQETSFRR